MIIRDDNRLRGLALANVVAGIVIAPIGGVRLPDVFGLASVLPPAGLERLPIVLLFASTLCQAFLLALWVATSPRSVPVRVLGLVLGSCWLEAMLAPGSHGEFVGTPTISIVVTTAVLLAGRAIGIGVVRWVEPGKGFKEASGGLQFSIRGLMAFTVAVAVLSSAARNMPSGQGHFLTLAAVWAMSFVAAGLVALWASLGEASPEARVAAAIFLSPLFGVPFAYGAGAHPAGWTYIILTMLVYSAALIGSMMVVRGAGYRLARRGRQAAMDPMLD